MSTEQPPTRDDAAGAIRLLAALALIAALATLRDVLEPLLVALLLSFMAMPFLRAGRKVGVPRVVMVILVIAAFFVGLTWIGTLVYASGYEFIERVPALEKQLRPLVLRALKISGHAGETLGRTADRIPWGEIVSSTRVVGYAGSTFSGFLGWIQELTLVVLFLIFILLDRTDGSLDRRIIAAFSDDESEAAEVAETLEQIDRDIERYLLVKASISLLTGVLVYMILVAGGVAFPVLFAAVAFFLNFIPNIGSVLATIPPILVSYLTYGGAGTVPVAVSLFVLQLGIGNFLDPWLMGKSLRLSPVTVLFSLILWNWLWGIPGMVLAVPITVVTRVILAQIPGYQHIAHLMSDDDGS